MKLLPKARTANIVIQNLKEEVLIYDLTTDQAFCLNETLARVFNHCDGNTSFADLKAKYHYTDEIIFLALGELMRRNLIESNYVSPLTGLSRRKVIRRVGLGSLVALPVVAVLVAPTAIAAASSNCNCAAPVNLNARVVNCPCGSNNDCCGVCIFNNGNPICSAPTAAAQPTAAACCPPLV